LKSSNAPFGKDRITSYVTNCPISSCISPELIHPTQSALFRYVSGKGEPFSDSLGEDVTKVKIHWSYMVYSIDDPSEMTSSERFQEIAGILAAGFLRMGKQSLNQPDMHQSQEHLLPPGNCPEVRELLGSADFGAKGLDVSHR